MDKVQESIVNRFSSFEAALNGEKSSDFHKIRLNAISDIKEKGLPGRKTEDWKFTFMTPKIESFLDIENADTEALESRFEKLESEFPDSINIFCLNGKWYFDSVKSEIKGLSILDFRSAAENFPDEFGKNFNTIASREERAFGKLNTAFVKEGLFIHLEKNTTVEKEIQLHIISDSAAGKVFAQPRMLVLLGENSELKLIENYVHQGLEPSYTNSCTEISLEKYARMQYYKLQLEDSEYYHSGLTAVIQQKESHFTAHAYSFGGGMVRNDLDIHLLDEHIVTNMYGAYVLNGKSHVDNHTSVNHAMPNCESNELYKGIMNDNSTAVFNGKIFVRKDAQKTNAFQSNRNLILSADATVHTKPQLEIWADDVKCSHGATIGQLDEEQLFYLRSRGIPKDRAISLLTHAFIGEVIEKIALPSVREKVDAVLNQRMEF